MSPLDFSYLLSKSQAVLELLSDTTANLNKKPIIDELEESEKECKEAFDDHYIFMRFSKENVSNILTTSEEKVAKIETRRKTELQDLEKIQQALVLKQKAMQTAEEELEDAIRALENVNNEVEAMTEKDSGASELREKQFPVLTVQQKLLFCVTRITWDEKRRVSDDPDSKVIRGYVVDPKKNDVSVFHVDTSELSDVTTSQFLWDYVASCGISRRWKNL